MKRSTKSKLTGNERCDILSSVAGRLALDVTELLKSAEAPKAYGRYRSFLKSLDGAIRHAQRQRREEEQEVASGVRKS